MSVQKKSDGPTSSSPVANRQILHRYYVERVNSDRGLFYTHVIKAFTARLELPPGKRRHAGSEFREAGHLRLRMNDFLPQTVRTG